MDENWARFICDQEEAGGVTPPIGDDDPGSITPLGYSPEIGRLDLVLDRLQSLESAVIWTAKTDAQRSQVRPMPRPETALDRERERRTRILLEEVDALFTGEGLNLTLE